MLVKAVWHLNQISLVGPSRNLGLVMQLRLTEPGHSITIGVGWLTTPTLVNHPSTQTLLIQAGLTAPWVGAACLAWYGRWGRRMLPEASMLHGAVSM